MNFNIKTRYNNYDLCDGKTVAKYPPGINVNRYPT